MLYITGIHALNLPCKLNTCGDWHQSGIQWNKPYMLESSGSIFGDYGIEPNHHIPEHSDVYNVADTIRASLDLLIESKFSVIQGMNEDFICNPDYDTEVFEKVLQLTILPHWNQINAFMKSEYRTKWINYKRSKGIYD